MCPPRNNWPRGKRRMRNVSAPRAETNLVRILDQNEDGDIALNAQRALSRNGYCQRRDAIYNVGTAYYSEGTGESNPV